jgi:hypothetical protein
MLYSDYQVHDMGHVLFVSFATHRCAKKKKKKKERKGFHNPSGLLQHNAKGNTCPMVFSNTMPKGTPAQWSFPTQ